MKDFALLNEETDRKCEVTGGYNTNARWDKGNLFREIQDLRFQGQDVDQSFNLVKQASSRWDYSLIGLNIS